MATRTVADNVAWNVFADLDVKAIALLLDVDGTLIDFGPSPQEVRVSDDLRHSLARLAQLTGGAIAMVSGRPIADIERLFAPLAVAAIGGHGAEMSVNGAHTVRRALPLPDDLRGQLAAVATAGSGIVVEDKGYSLALHFRSRPQQKELLRRHIAAVCARFAGVATEVLPGHAVFEVKRPGVSKGGAVRELMHHPPFAGRMPVFIGDDVTDESVFAVMPELGGRGFSVGRPFAGLAGTFESPTQVRSALRMLASGGRMP